MIAAQGVLRHRTRVLRSPPTAPESSPTGAGLTLTGKQVLLVRGSAYRGGLEPLLLAALPMDRRHSVCSGVFNAEWSLVVLRPPGRSTGHPTPGKTLRFRSIRLDVMPGLDSYYRRRSKRNSWATQLRWFARASRRARYAGAG